MWPHSGGHSRLFCGQNYFIEIQELCIDHSAKLEMEKSLSKWANERVFKPGHKRVQQRIQLATRLFAHTKHSYTQTIL